MRTITTTVYNFDELSPEAQEKAIENLCDINVDSEWWQPVYEDAEAIGMKITDFDLGRSHYLKAQFTLCPLEICKAIFEEHGEDTTTYQIAMDYMHSHNLLSKLEVQRLCQEEDQLCVCFCYIGSALDVDQDCFDESVFEDIDNTLHHVLQEEYLSILRREYEYRTSEEAITEVIRLNEYEFTEEGNCYDLN